VNSLCFSSRITACRLPGHSVSKSSAFTLVELLIVVVILGILATVVLPLYAQANHDAKLATLRSDLNTVRRVLMCFKFEKGDKSLDFPTGHGGFYMMAALTSGEGTHLSSIPVNPFTGTNRVRSREVQEDGTDASAWYLWVSADHREFKFRANDSLEHAKE